MVQAGILAALLALRRFKTDAGYRAVELQNLTYHCRHGAPVLLARPKRRQAADVVHHPVPGHHGRLRRWPDQVQTGEQRDQALHSGYVGSKVIWQFLPIW